MKRFKLVWVMLMVGLLTVTTLTATATDSLAATKPILNLTTGHVGYTAVELKWSKVAKATKYEFQYSTNKDFKNATSIIRVKSAWASNIKNATTYHIRYRALTPSKVKGVFDKSVWSAPITRTTQANYPAKFSNIKAVPQKDAIALSWDKNLNANTWKVLISSTPDMKRKTKTYNLTRPNVVLKDLPNSTATGEPNFVRIFATNNGKVTRQSERFEFFPQAVMPTGKENIRIASYNVLCVTCTENRPSWDNRKTYVINNIVKANPDVIGLQEVSMTKVNNSGLRQAEEVSRLLKPKGYTMVDYKNYDNQWKGFQSPRIAFKTDKYKLLSKGHTRFYTEGGTETMRFGAWAKLKSKSTGKEFFISSLHLDSRKDSGNGSTMNNYKMKHTQQMIDVIKKQNPKNLPVIVTGDFNSHLYSTPYNGTQDVMVKNGFYDMAAAKVKVMRDYSTYNDYKAAVTNTYGRVDYIFTKGMNGSLRYENFIKVKDKKIQGFIPSDHNLIFADGKF